jgi:CBS-domain-containing membrane protein
MKKLFVLGAMAWPALVPSAAWAADACTDFLCRLGGAAVSRLGTGGLLAAVLGLAAVLLGVRALRHSRSGHQAPRAADNPGA